MTNTNRFHTTALLGLLKLIQTLILGTSNVNLDSDDPRAVHSPSRPAILPQTDSSLLDLPKETDLRLQNKFPDTLANYTGVNLPATVPTPMDPPKEGEGGAIALFLRFSLGKLFLSTKRLMAHCKK